LSVAIDIDLKGLLFHSCYDIWTNYSFGNSGFMGIVLLLISSSHLQNL